MALVSAFGLLRFSVFGVTDFDINHDKIEVIFGFCWLERLQGLGEVAVGVRMGAWDCETSCQISWKGGQIKIWQVMKQ